MPRNYVRTNPLLGHVKCRECSQLAEVYQTKRSGRHFYTDSKEGGCQCGKNDGTGAPRQQRIYDELDILDGATVIRPSNVTDKPRGELVPASVSEKEPGEEVVTDKDSDREWTPDDMNSTEIDADTEQPETSRKGLIGLLVVSAATIAGIVWNQ